MTGVQTCALPISTKDFKDFDSAVKSFPTGSEIDVLAAYTAFHSLVRA